MEHSNTMEDLCLRARQSGQILAGSSIEARNGALRCISSALSVHRDEILAANAADLEAASKSGLSSAVTKVGFTEALWL